jgi:beta-galactosidase
MGNSNGSLSDYYALMEEFFDHGYQGGFIWEWVDHGIRKKDSNGHEFFAYGGDFGEEPHDANFVCDGLVGPDRELHPACMELKYLARPVRLGPVDWKKGEVTLENRRDFAQTSDIRVKWFLKEEGKVIAQGTLAQIPIPANASRSFILKGLGKALETASGETFLQIDFINRSKTSCLPAGHLFASEQCKAPVKAKQLSPRRPTKTTRPKLEQSGDSIIVKVGNRTWEWDKQSGLLVSHVDGKQKVIAAPVSPALWRAATDNDGLKLWRGQEDKALGKWRKLGLEKIQFKCTGITASVKPDGTIEVRSSLKGSGRKRYDDFRVDFTYLVPADGSWQLETRFCIGNDITDLPRIGVQMELDEAFNRIDYFGRGPWENYNDRKASAQVDIHTKRLTDCTLPYVMPQEYGHHTDTRWLRLKGGNKALRIHSDDVFEFNYVPYPIPVLFSTLHREELPDPKAPHLTLDLAHRGVGTRSCGPDTRPEYRISGNEFTRTFYFNI